MSAATSCIPALDGTHRGVEAGLSGWRQALAFLIACAIIFARRPDAILHAQFLAEDGPIWYATAYNLGWWKVLFSPYAGYLNLAPRLAAALALLAPLRHAPLIENLFAIVAQALPVNLLLSRRSSSWGPLRFRIALAALYLALPNTREMIATVTETQWFLALAALLILFAEPPSSRIEWAAALTLLTLCALTGPFCIFLIPIAIIAFHGRPATRWSKTVFSLLGLASAAQAAAFLAFRSVERPHPHLGIGIVSGLRILAGQVYLGTIAGATSIGAELPFWAILLIAGVGTFAIIRCFTSAPPAMRALLIFALMIFAASLAAPTATPRIGETAWEELSRASGIRYWFFPCLGFCWSIAYGVRNASLSFKIPAYCLAALMVFGLVRDFRYAPLPDGHFPLAAAQFEAAPPNSTVTIRTLPQGWQMVLVKH